MNHLKNILIKTILAKPLIKVLNSADLAKRAKLNEIRSLNFISDIEKLRIQRIFKKRIQNNDNSLFFKDYNELLIEVKDRLDVRPIEPIKIIKVDDMHFEEVFKDSIQRKVPLVIKGLKINKDHFTLNNLIELYGDLEVRFTDVNRLKNKTFYDKFKTILNSTRYVQNVGRFSNKETNRHLELNQIRNLLVGFGDKKASCYLTQLFVSAVQNTGSWWHCADADNFFFMLEGEKRWTLIDPIYTYLFSPYFVEKGTYTLSLAGNCVKPIKQYCPLYDYIPKLQSILVPGDVLFNPSRWWHSVINLTKETVGCSTRWKLSSTETTSKLFENLRTVGDYPKFAAQIKLDFFMDFLNNSSFLEIIKNRKNLSNILSEPVDDELGNYNPIWEESSEIDYERILSEFPLLNNKN